MSISIEVHFVMHGQYNPSRKVGICNIWRFFVHTIYMCVTGSGKRDNFAHTIIFQYKCCCSKTPTFIKNKFWPLT